MERMAAEAVPGCMDELHALLDRFWAQAGQVDAAVRARFDTAVAEVVANVVAHGRTPAGGVPMVRVALSGAEGRIVAEIADDGVPVPDDGVGAGPADPLAEGGRGLTLVRAAADEVGYARADEENRWRLVVRL